MPLVTPAVDVVVMCQFDNNQQIQCWVGDGSGGTGRIMSRADPSGISGVLSNSTQTRVFAGLANDPYFFLLGRLREHAQCNDRTLPPTRSIQPTSMLVAALT